MSLGQLMELVIFAAVVFVVINKLLATLGTDSERNSKKPKSFFGDNTLKDVTNSAEQKSDSVLFRKYRVVSNIDDIIVSENKQEILEGLSDLERKLDIKHFSLDKFLDGAKIAIKMILDCVDSQEGDLEQLVDKRYITNFKNFMKQYGSYITDKNDLSAKISEIYVFGNNIFIKVFFFGKRVVSNIEDFNEEWTFTKQAKSQGLDWYLCNVE